MNKWLCLSLQIAVIIGTALVIYFFPAEESVDDFARGLLGFIVVYCLEGFKEEKGEKELNEIHNQLAEACKNTTKYADKLLLEYMNKRGLTIEDLQGNVIMQHYPMGTKDEDCDTLTYWYKGELILKVKQKFDFTQPLVTKCEMVIEKGEW